MLNLKNNFIFPPIKAGYSKGNGLITPKHLSFYERRCKYIGALTPEPMYMDAGLRELPTQIGIDNDDKIPGLKSLTDILHRYNTKAIAHLNHPGRMANPKLPGNYYLSSSDLPCETRNVVPKAMTKDDIDNVVKLFCDTAIRSEKAGFDIIELQFGHGYLASQFISPKVNNRKDEYGGSFENRIRFALEILDAVKNAVKLPVMVRISADEMLPDGIKLPEMINFAKILDEKGIDALHVSAGTVCSTPPWFFQHMFVPKGKTWEFADKIRETIKTPVVYVGKINEFKDIESISGKSKNNYLSVGRALVADPDFIGKYLGEVKGKPAPCLACSEGCMGGVKSGNGLGCIVNPIVGLEDTVIVKAGKAKNVAVVGAGLAGMSAAVSLHKRGHEVTVFEKDKPGGQFLLASLPPHKESMHKLTDFLIESVNDLKIKIIATEFTKADIENFDEVVIATGSKPMIPPIEGLKKYFWAEVLEEQNLPEDKNALVIGGGLIGTEISAKLLSKNNKVYLVEILDEIARGMEMIEQKLTLKSFEKSDINVFLNTTVTKIDGKDIYIENKEMKQKLENIDLIILATGMKSYNPFEEMSNTDKIHIIGDANKVGKAKQAIEDGYYIASKI